MGIIPLDEECFWCIIPYTHHVELCRQNSVEALEEIEWEQSTTAEKEDICNKMIKEVASKYLDFPDVSKRPKMFDEEFLERQKNETDDVQ
ncbi:MAG: hypothetical protein PHQ11_13990 [Paludibacter sp.]|nr:hypothetical protein [Paludibacter sp.]